MHVAIDSIPVACTLPADALRERSAWIRRVTEESLLSHRLEGATLTLAYRIGAKAELEQIVAHERQCCTFLRFELREIRGVLKLTIEAPTGLGNDARWLFDQFMPAAAGGPPVRGCGCASGGCG